MKARIVCKNLQARIAKSMLNFVTRAGPPGKDGVSAPTTLILDSPPLDFYSGCLLEGSFDLSGDGYLIHCGMDLNGAQNSRPMYRGYSTIFTIDVAYNGTQWILRFTQQGFFLPGQVPIWLFLAAPGTEATPNLANWAGGTAPDNGAGVPVLTMGAGGTAAVPGQIAIVAEYNIYLCARQTPVRWRGPLALLSDIESNL